MNIGHQIADFGIAKRPTRHSGIAAVLRGTVFDGIAEIRIRSESAVTIGVQTKSRYHKVGGFWIECRSNNPVTGTRGTMARGTGASAIINLFSGCHVSCGCRCTHHDCGKRQGDNKDPAFSPDCRLIAFSSNRRGSPGVYLSGQDGLDQNQVIDGVAETVRWAR